MSVMLDQLPDDVKKRLEAYASLLEKWNAKINLIGRSTVADIWTRHIEDSLHLMSFFPEKSACLVDVGTGAGLPGLILAAAGWTDCHLVEVDQKKAGFLRIASGTCDMPATIHACRVQDVMLEDVRYITARAYAALTNIFATTSHLCNAQTVYVLPKGRQADAEIEAAKKAWNFTCEKHPGFGPDSWVLRVTDVSRLAAS